MTPFPVSQSFGPFLRFSGYDVSSSKGGGGVTHSIQRVLSGELTSVDFLCTALLLRAVRGQQGRARCCWAGVGKAGSRPPTWLYT